MQFKRNRKHFNSSTFFGLGFVICAAVSAFIHFYFQVHLKYEVSALCQAQQLVILLLAVTYLLAYPHRTNSIIKFFALLLFIISLCGLIFAYHQISYAAANSCGPELIPLFKAHTLKEIWKILWHSKSCCLSGEWSLFSIDLAGWFMIFFILATIFNLWEFLRKEKPSTYHLFH